MRASFRSEIRDEYRTKFDWSNFRSVPGGNTTGAGSIDIAPVNYVIDPLANPLVAIGPSFDESQALPVFADSAD